MSHTICIYTWMAKAYILQEFEELIGRVDLIDKKLWGYLFEPGYGYHILNTFLTDVMKDNINL